MENKIVTLKAEVIENLVVNFPSDETAKSTMWPDNVKKSVNNFRHPSKDFVECKTLIEINEMITTNRTPVLHLYGFPGSGKSAIVRKLAAEFPFNASQTQFVKYLVECNDSNEDIDDSLKDLVKQMWECNLVSNKSKCDRAREQLKTKRTVGFVELLVEAAIPVLIVIEDPPDEQLEILNDLVSSFHNTISNQTRKGNNMHLCVTSQSQNICKFSCFHCCKKVQVDGLTEEEGLKLLGVSCADIETERNAALEVIGCLHGSPLGLIAVRATCRKSHLCYEEYDQLRDVSHHKEIEHLKEEFGPHNKHLYQAIVTLLDEKGLWDTMKVLSFFHHGSIPQRLIGNVKLRQKAANDHPSELTFRRKKYLIKQESGEFISRLEDFVICDVVGKCYEETTVTLHQVVFLSVQTYVTDKESPLRDAAFSLASLVLKDIRTHFDYKFICGMCPHILSVLKAFDSRPAVNIDFVTSMVVVHLREVYGNATKYFDSIAAEESLMKCARTIWNEISKRSRMKQEFDDLLNQKNVLKTDVTQPIFEACLAAGDQLRNDEKLLDTYICAVTQFKPGHHDALNNGSTNQEVVERLKLLSKYSLPLSPDELRSFRRLEDGKLFLDIKTHCQVFFIDRLVSVLYSLGRVILYDTNVTEEKRRKFAWIFDVAHALCEQCRQRTGVNLLYLRLSAINRINARLKNFSTIEAKARKNILTDAMSMVESNLKEMSNETDVFFYENGLSKTMEENAFDELSSLRAMIRIHMKLLPLCSDEEEAKLVKQSADQFYKRLCEQASAFTGKWILSSKCYVYCGKYMASLGNYVKAIEHFKEALSCQAITDEKINLFPWVCYNYARVTVVGRLHMHREDAIDKCSEALKYQGDISENLGAKLKEQLDFLLCL